MDDRPGEKGKGLLCGSAIEVILGIPCHAYHALAAMVYFPSNSSHIAALMQAMFNVFSKRTWSGSQREAFWDF